MEEVFWEWVKEVNWVTFGIAPLLSGMAGYVFSVLLFEVIITLPWCGLISYQNKKEKKEKKEKKGEEGELKRGREERWANIEKIQAKFPFWRQFFGGLMTFISPVGWVNAVVMAIILSFSIPSFREQCWGEEQQQEEREEEREELKEKLIHYFLCGWGGMVEGLPGWGVGVVKFLGMVVVNDFFLYWGHRVQHESEFLWNNFHYFHHQLTTPTPVGLYLFFFFFFFFFFFSSFQYQKNNTTQSSQPSHPPPPPPPPPFPFSLPFPPKQERSLSTPWTPLFKEGFPYYYQQLSLNPILSLFRFLFFVELLKMLLIMQVFPPFFFFFFFSFLSLSSFFSLSHPLPSPPLPSLPLLPPFSLRNRFILVRIYNYENSPSSSKN